MINELLMVVFGAGASFDSSASHPATPDISGWEEVHRAERLPLADSLFEERGAFALIAGRFKKLTPIIPYLREPKTGSVEQTLESLREEADYPERQKQLASIRFYLQWTIWDCQRKWTGLINEVTSYRTFLDQVNRKRKDEQVCFVTFNYDTLLEEAFISYDRRFASVDDYVSNIDFMVFKLHGSVNWVREIKSEIYPGVEGLGTSDSIGLANEIVDNIDRLTVGDTFHIIQKSNSALPVSQMKIPDADPDFPIQAVLPAIAIPVVRKHLYECPSTHVDRLKAILPETSKLIVIGWRGAEVNFTDLLAQQLPKDIPKLIVSSSRDSGRKIAANLEESGLGTGKWFCPEGGFARLVRSRLIEDFLTTGSI